MPTGEIRRTVLVELPLNGRPNGAVHSPDHEILFDEILNVAKFDGFEGPFINGVLAVFMEQFEQRTETDEELVALAVAAVHRAIIRTGDDV